MKRLFCLILCLILTLTLAACGPAPSGPTETVANPFTQGTTAAPEESTGASTSSGSYSGSPTFPPDFEPGGRGCGFFMHYDRFPEADGHVPTYNTAEYIYQGGEIQIPFALYPDGFEYTGLGLIAFLDGIPQPFRLNEEDDYQYMNILYLPDGEYEFTASLLPVTGTVGQWSELWIMLVYAPDFENHDLDYVGYEDRAGFGSWTSVLFLAEPEKPAALPVEDRGISQTVSYEKLSYEEALAKEEAQGRLDHVVNYTINGGKPEQAMTRVYGTTAETPVTVRLTLCGPSDISYRLVFYYDDLPLTTQPTEVIDYDDGEKVVIEATVDLTGFDGYARLTGFLVPLNSEMNPDGTLTANQVFCDCAVDLVLTSAKDKDEFFSENG